VVGGKARTGLAAGGLLIILLAVIGAGILAAISGNSSCSSSAPQSAPSSEAKRDIPADFLAVYQQIGAKYQIPWEVLAGIGREECDHGRLPDPSCTPQPGASGPGAANFAGAAGPMQIGIGGAAGNEFARIGVDADGDGKIGTHDPADAVAMAARVLIKDKGAPIGKPIDAYRTAVRAYNGSGPQAEAYADRVMADAHTYEQGTNPVADAAPTGCSDTGLTGGGIPGKVIIAPGANRPGVGLQRILLNYVAQIAGLYGKPVTISTGTNHDQMTVDGNVSDHWDGHAADLGMAANGGTDDGPVGDKLMTACLLLAGEPEARAKAEAERGGLYTLVHNHMRIQCIWKTNEGGNHHNHVHVGVQPA
jgi:hypothetical protein